MPVTVDTCLGDLYEPGFTTVDPGEDPAEPTDFIPSLDFSIPLNSQYFAVI
jgi:hypothetical protein